MSCSRLRTTKETAVSFSSPGRETRASFKIAFLCCLLMPHRHPQFSVKNILFSASRSLENHGPRLFYFCFGAEPDDEASLKIVLIFLVLFPPAQPSSWATTNARCSTTIGRRRTSRKSSSSCRCVWCKQQQHRRTPRAWVFVLSLSGPSQGGSHPSTYLCENTQRPPSPSGVPPPLVCARTKQLRNRAARRAS